MISDRNPVVSPADGLAFVRNLCTMATVTFALEICVRAERTSVNIMRCSCTRACCILLPMLQVERNQAADLAAPLLCSILLNSDKRAL